jgi:RNA 2',3'-cyclic 3'-phosphodiesterase
MAESPTKLRLFIALNLPESVKDSVAKAQSELREAIPAAAIRWTTRDQFHVTLKFLGGVDAQVLPALIRGLAAACEPFSPLQVRAANIGVFPNPRRPRVIWAGLHDREQRLGSLQEAIQAATQAFTVEEGEKRFAGHVTLGRVKEIRRSDAEALAKIAAQLSGHCFGEWRADEIHLMQSELSSSGARYTELFAASLARSSACHPPTSGSFSQGDARVAPFDPI